MRNLSLGAKLALLNTALVAAVVLSIAGAVTAAQRRALEEQSRRRLDVLTDGVVRLAQEAADARDPLMLISYLMHLRKDHPELAVAAVTSKGHTAVLGEDRAGLTPWTRRVAVRGALRITVAAAAATADALSVSTAAVTLKLDEDARVQIEREEETSALDLRLGFDPSVIEAEIARGLAPLSRRTGLIAGVFLLLGWAAAVGIGKVVGGPVAALAMAATAVKKGDYEVEVPQPGGSDEVAVLAARFNEMTAHLRELTRFREDLLHTVTHELNTPLAGLKGYLELWREGKLGDGPERAEALTIMMAAVSRMERSLGSALSLFKEGLPSAGPRSIVWLDDVAREACLLFAAEAEAKKIALESPAKGAAAFLYADPELLRQILVNLLSNAIKYTPEGGRVTVTLFDDGRRAGVVVADTGRGISAEDLPRLFTKFFRADKDRRVGGTGLGLSIAKSAARALGGDIAVESRLGEGSRFTAEFLKPAPRTEAAS